MSECDLISPSRRSTVSGSPLPNKTAMPHQEILNRPDGSQVRLLAQDYSLPGQLPAIGVDVFRRANPHLNWQLCSNTPDPDWRFMSVQEYVERGRSEALRFVSPGEIAQAVGRLLEAQKNAPPPFMPWFRGDAGTVDYDDGRVFGAVTISPFEDGAAVAIHEWWSKYPRQGHTTQALAWMRQRGVRHIEAHGVGTLDPSGVQMDETIVYWAHMVNKGLVDRLFDDHGEEIFVREGGSIEYATASDAPRMRA